MTFLVGDGYVNVEVEMNKEGVEMHVSHTRSFEV